MKRTLIINTKLNAAILGTCAISAVFYAINLYSLISHTVAMQQTEGRAVLLASALSSLDAEYLKLTSAITPDALAEHGLVPGQVSLYITRPAATAAIGNLAAHGHEL